MDCNVFLHVIRIIVTCKLIDNAKITLHHVNMICINSNARLTLAIYIIFILYYAIIVIMIINVIHTPKGKINVL